MLSSVHSLPRAAATQVFQNGQVGKAAPSFGHEPEAEPCDAVRPHAGDLAAAEADRSGARPCKAAESELIVVVLPMPLRPISATTSPSPTSRSTPNSACEAP